MIGKILLMPGLADTTPLSITVISDNRRPSLAVKGKVDYSNVSRVVSALENMASEHERCVSLDFHDLESMDTTALEGLVGAIDTYKHHRKRLRLERASGTVLDMLDRLQLSDLFCCCDTCSCGCCPESCEVNPDSFDMDVFTIPSTIPQTREARERVGRFAESAGFTGGPLNDVLLAVGEAAVNAVKYGRTSEESSFTISCLVTSEKLCVSVSDSGPGFSLEDIPSFEDALFMEHGRGIYCMNAVMDEVDFSFDSGTTVRMVKYCR
ncbi:MAG: ATP-binding protein [Armatimonadota bacterium]|nr:ATP-binding protein [bacterium]